MISQSYYPTKVHIEPGGWQRWYELFARPVERLFVVTGKSAMETAGVLDRLRQQCRDLGVTLEIHKGLNTNPTNLDIDAIVESCRSFGPDLVMGLGGGSSIDAAKMVAMLMTNQGDSWDYISADGRAAKKITDTPTPVIAIPTTSGAGSEATPYAVITHAQSRMKKGMGSPLLYPALAILDPELLALMPKYQIAVTGFDAFGQALEGYTSGKSTIHSEHYGWSALQLIAENLPKSFNSEDMEVKARMAWGASLAGLSIGLVDVNLAHAMSHPLSGIFNIQHGLAVALCTCPAIWFNRDHVGDKYCRVASLMGHKTTDRSDAAKCVIDYVQERFTQFGISPKLADHGVTSEQMPNVTADALEIGAIRTNARQVEASHLEALFGAALRGTYV